ncbi:MAG: cation diffusion facilitator family transporter [Clostridia bacterium]
MDKRSKSIKKVSILSLIANMILLILKLFIGLLSNSQAMIADALNSAGDIFASSMSFIGAKLSSKPNDKDHPYGHGKAEYIFSMLISLSMIVASILMIKNAILSIVNKTQIIFSVWLVVVCIVVICTKVLLYIYSKNKNIKNGSILIKSIMEDHRNDIFVTTGTLMGIVSSYFGLYFVDGFVGISISIWILIVGIRLFKEAYKTLMDTNISLKEENEIIEYVTSNEEVLHVDSIIARPIGQQYVIILKLSMNSYKTLEQCHKLSGIIKSQLMEKFEYISDVVIHINPHEN